MNGDVGEFAIEWIRGSKVASVTAASASALKSKIMKLAEEYPDKVQVLRVNQDGSIFAHVPVSFVRITQPRKISEEQAAAAAERFRKMWEQKKANNGSEEENDQ